MHGICAGALWRSTRTGRFICQCSALVNPFLVILHVFYAWHSLPAEISADNGQPEQVSTAKSAKKLALLITSPQPSKTCTQKPDLKTSNGYHFCEKCKKETANYRLFSKL